MLWLGWKVYSTVQVVVWDMHILLFGCLFMLLLPWPWRVWLAWLACMDCKRTYYMGDGFVGLLLVVVVWGVVYVPIYYLLAYAAARIAVNDDDLLL